ncbi:Hydroxyproline O-galactosyltransferase GALT5 [Sesamum angolense]|uniref:Hydroxyproline O-galactosyltransferase GALT5 n=1 Tax=Sesamum angolense TaxID=2727404 RepID=A0AAE1X0V4_9LAMI|nr:Hydroxyproline O-galactosyltransferase GALT5 [Sesamum angolense]
MDLFFSKGFTLEDATGLFLNGDVGIDSVFAASLPTSHPSTAPPRLLELSPEWKAEPSHWTDGALYWNGQRKCIQPMPMGLVILYDKGNRAHRSLRWNAIQVVALWFIAYNWTKNSINALAWTTSFYLR